MTVVHHALGLDLSRLQIESPLASSTSHPHPSSIRSVATNT